MKRRHFLSLGSTTTALAGCATVTTLQRPVSAQQNLQSKPVKMVVGTQRSPTTPQMLQYIKRHGVDHICGYPPNPGERGYWTVDDLEKTRELCEKHGLALDIVALPFLTSSHIDGEKRGAIMLGKIPERDRDIEHINLMTENCAKADIPRGNTI